MLARVLIAQDQPGQALPLLKGLYARAAAQDHIGSLIEIQSLRALALAAQGDDVAAATALTEALRLACPQGYVRVFADEGPPMAALLGRLAAAQRTRQTAVTRTVPCRPATSPGWRGRSRRPAQPVPRARRRSWQLRRAWSIR